VHVAPEGARELVDVVELAIGAWSAASASIHCVADRDLALLSDEHVLVRRQRVDPIVLRARHGLELHDSGVSAHHDADVVDARQLGERAWSEARAREAGVSISHAAGRAVALVVETIGVAVAVVVYAVRAGLFDLHRRLANGTVAASAVATDEPYAREQMGSVHT
jgi:hypothetical protein